uniref:Uncharacterized protein n=1 Tax=Anopheles quadriannulatus TaxID=34691 RepID=A0A182XT04_ANOQN
MTLWQFMGDTDNKFNGKLFLNCKRKQVFKRTKLKRIE